MADGTTIEWCDATWNPITGCSVLSPGCTNCYAMRLAGTRLKHEPSRAGLTRDGNAGPVWTGEVRLNEAWLDQPLRWRRPRRIFVCAHGDLFHEAVPDAWIDRVFAVMALCPSHIFLVLTKRAERMRSYITQAQLDVWDAMRRVPGALRRNYVTMRDDNVVVQTAPEWPLPQVWLGVSVEDQKRADERIPLLLDTPAAKRFISAEPLLGPVDLRSYLRSPTRIDWTIVGGESGPGARPMHPDWARSLRDQWQSARAPFFFKQWGEWAPCPFDGPHDPASHHRFLDGTYMLRVGKRAAGRLLDGREWKEVPA